MAVATVTTALSTFQITRNNSIQFRTLLSSRSSEFITSSSQSLLLLADNNKLVVAPWIQQSSSLHVIAEANSTTRKKEKSEPRYSKAARRFYNENFSQVSEKRLSKLLAAAGVVSRRSCEDLIFDGCVTVNGSVCNTPQLGRLDVATTRVIIVTNDGTCTITLYSLISGRRKLGIQSKFDAKISIKKAL